MARSSSLTRRLDLALGAPLIALLSRTRRPRALPLRPARIAVLQPTALGDAILSSGVIAHLARTHPEAAITVFHGPSNGAAMPLIAARFETQVVHFARPWDALAAVRAFGPDLTVDLTPWPRATALIAMLSGGVACGFASEGQRRAGAFDVAVPHRGDRHEVENFAAMAACLGQAEGRYAMTLRRGHPAPALPLPYARLVLAHPCAGGSRAGDRAWPISHWAAFAAGCRARGLTLAFTGAPADEPAIREILAAIGAPESQVLSLAGKLRFSELAGVIERARALISVDTGVLHLGAALGAPVIGLHGPSRASRWGGYGPNAIGLDSPYPGAGFTIFGFEPAAEGAAMMAAIRPETALAALAAQLHRARIPA